MSVAGATPAGQFETAMDGGKQSVDGQSASRLVDRAESDEELSAGEIQEANAAESLDRSESGSEASGGPVRDEAFGGVVRGEASGGVIRGEVVGGEVRDVYVGRSHLDATDEVNAARPLLDAQLLDARHGVNAGRPLADAPGEVNAARSLLDARLLDSPHEVNAGGLVSGIPFSDSPHGVNAGAPLLDVPLLDAPHGVNAGRPLLDAPQTVAASAAMWTFVVGPMIGLALVVLFAWGWGLTTLDLGMAAVAYLISGLGIAVGYHRLFTHRAFKARRGLRIALAVAGSLAVEGSPLQWVANHRRHHAYSDREGDPHSPWRYGTSARAIFKGLLYAHVGWMLKRELSNRARFAPDIAADRDLLVVGKLFGALTALSLLGPALIGWLVTGRWTGALAGFFWAGVIRMALLHHVTWSVNSICHVVGKRPFASRDRAANFWPLALLSFGESWHNSHHADPSGARHGVLPGQIDVAARVIWLFERLGWARDVRWPRTDRLSARLLPDPAAVVQEAQP